MHTNHFSTQAHSGLLVGHSFVYPLIDRTANQATVVPVPIPEAGQVCLKKFAAILIDRSANQRITKRPLFFYPSRDRVNPHAENRQPIPRFL